MDAVAREAGVARTTLYRRYRDKADLVSAAINTLRQPSRRQDTGDARADLIAQLENARRNFDMSLAGTLLMEEPHDPRLIELFRDGW
jgi:AcrR family transcriptional regulator